MAEYSDSREEAEVAHQDIGQVLQSRRSDYAFISYSYETKTWRAYDIATVSLSYSAESSSIDAACMIIGEQGEYASCRGRAENVEVAGETLNASTRQTFLAMSRLKKLSFSFTKHKLTGGWRRMILLI